MSKVLMARVLTALMPEKLLVEKTIEALVEYQEAKYGPSESFKEVSEETEGEDNSSLKNFFKNNDHLTTSSSDEEGREDVEKPFAQLITLMMKWQDEGKEMSDIFKENEGANPLFSNEEKRTS